MKNHGLRPLALAGYDVSASGSFDTPLGAAERPGDVTGMVLLWDAGTEVNEEQAVRLGRTPRQGSPDSGAAEGGVIRPVNDGLRHPDVSDVIPATLTGVG